jgi:hypothetical protein
MRENTRGYINILQRGGGGASRPVRPVGERDAQEPAPASYDSRRPRNWLQGTTRVQLRGDEEGVAQG